MNPSCAPVRRSRGRIGHGTAVMLVSIASACIGIRSARDDVNIAFTVDRNQLVLTNMRVEGHAGRFVLATAMPKSIVDRRFATSRGLPRIGPFHALMSDTVPLRIDANVLDLHGVMDGMIGADVLGPVLSIDYRRRIVSIARSFDPGSEGIEVYEYRGDTPTIPIALAGAERRCIVDTALPDSLVVPESWLPDASGDRVFAAIEVAGLRFDHLDLQRAPVPHGRVGNRVLSRFLLVVDFRRKRVALWPQPGDDTRRPSPIQ